MQVLLSRGRRASGLAASGLSILGLALLPLGGVGVAAGGERHEPREIAGFAGALTRMCHDLSSAREELTAGKVDEVSFTDRMLELFVQADSMRAALGGSPWVREPGTGVALERGFHFLIVSLRENYFGITERDGMRFASADRALAAAVAWRSGAASASDLVLP
jgi:hypothetical protein